MYVSVSFPVCVFAKALACDKCTAFSHLKERLQYTIKCRNVRLECLIRIAVALKVSPIASDGRCEGRRVCSCGCNNDKSPRFVFEVMHETQRIGRDP